MKTKIHKTLSTQFGVRPYYIFHRAGCDRRSTLLQTYSRTKTSLSSQVHRPIRYGIRYASTSRDVATDARSFVTRLKNIFIGTAIGISLVFGYFYVTDTRAGIHQWIVVPSLRWIYEDAEEAHTVGIKSLKGLFELGLHPRERGNPDALGDLKTEVFGHILANPIGTSAGIDKNAEIPSPLLALGPAIIEVGGATPYPQDGNPKPRVFRLPSQKALINRYGLNSEGADAMAMRLRQRLREFAYSMGFGIDEAAEQRVLDGEAGVPPGSLVAGKLMAVQVAKNKFTLDDDIDAVKADYVYCVETLARYADIIVVNVSSPNTPGLRNLQRVEPLTNILTGVVEAAKKVNRRNTPAVMVKVSPDEDSEEQVLGICDAVSRSGVDGVIVANTTKKRPAPLPIGYELSGKETALMLEQGGYSGPQLFEKTLKLVKRYRTILDEDTTIMTNSNVSPRETRSTPNDSKTENQKALAGDLMNELSEQKQATVSEDSQNRQELQDTNIISSQRSQGNSSSDINSSKHDASAPLSSVEPDRVPNQDTIQPQPLPPGIADSQQFEDDIQPQPLPPGISDKSIQPQPLPPGFDDEIQPQPLPPGVNDEIQPQPLPPGVNDEIQPQPLPPGTQRKIIFASGGITNGKQALEVLEAGATVAMVYSTLVYRGVGSITRIKAEMREEMKKAERRKGSELKSP